MDASDWDARYDRDDLIWTAEPNRFLVAETADLAPGRALDLACGEGRNAVWLATKGWRATAVDFSGVALAKAARLAAAHGVELERVHADLLEYEPARASVDLVIVFYLQLADPGRATVLRRAANALAPGATLLIVAHDSTNLADGYGGPKDASVLYSPDDVVSAIEPADLRVERAERVHRPVQTDEGERFAIDCLVRASRT
ncbi:MAG TPA: class I SAM-dependent methyltransferase [Acidimicrobiia bacterium]